MSVQLLRIADVCGVLGIERAKLYADMADGRFPQPVKIGRASAWPDYEVQAIAKALIAGKSAEGVRTLVKGLEEARASVAA